MCAISFHAFAPFTIRRNDGLSLSDAYRSKSSVRFTIEQLNAPVYQSPPEDLVSRKPVCCKYVLFCGVFMCGGVLVSSCFDHTFEDVFQSTFCNVCVMFGDVQASLRMVFMLLNR